MGKVMVSKGGVKEISVWKAPFKKVRAHKPMSLNG